MSETLPSEMATANHSQRGRMRLDFAVRKGSIDRGLAKIDVAQFRADELVDHVARALHHLRMHLHLSVWLRGKPNGQMALQMWCPRKWPERT